MSEEEKKKPFFNPNGLYRLKNTIGILSVLIGFYFAVLFWAPFLVGFFSWDFEVMDNVLEFAGTLKIDVGLAILLGSIIISGGILLSGIRKV